ncbi:MAG: hypothetical protein ACE5SW_10140 [Nitrososphaeraceae archaeon]
MSEKLEKHIRIKQFQAASFDQLINQVNDWLIFNQEKNHATFEFIDMKYQCEPPIDPNGNLEYTAIAIYKDSVENLSKDANEENKSFSDEHQFIKEKKEIEYRQ